MNLPIVSQHTYEKIDEGLGPMVLVDCLDISPRKDVTQILKVKMVLQNITKHKMKLQNPKFMGMYDGLRFS